MCISESGSERGEKERERESEWGYVNVAGNGMSVVMAESGCNKLESLFLPTLVFVYKCWMHIEQ
jgi:hypothetical protein